MSNFARRSRQPPGVLPFPLSTRIEFASHCALEIAQSTLSVALSVNASQRSSEAAFLRQICPRNFRYSSQNTMTFFFFLFFFHFILFKRNRYGCYVISTIGSVSGKSKIAAHLATPLRAYIVVLRQKNFK